jgi:hypothetical protein
VIFIDTNVFYNIFFDTKFSEFARRFIEKNHKLVLVARDSITRVFQNGQSDAKMQMLERFFEPQGMFQILNHANIYFCFSFLV